MTCIHVEEYLLSKTNATAIDALLHCIVFPNSEKAFTYKASLVCSLCKDGPVEQHETRPKCLLACVHCIHFACWTNFHIDQHAETHPEHLVSICLERGEFYCSVCQDFIYTEKIEKAYQHALSQYNSIFGLSERPWRPTYKELQYIPHLQAVSTPVANPGSRRTRGLVNMGNTCFLNVVVQALTHTPVLRDFLLSDLHRCDNPMRSRNCLACEMIRITQEIYRPVMNPFVPSNLLHTIWLHASHLAGYEQRDAHEFLITLLTLIHSHLVEEQLPREEKRHFMQHLSAAKICVASRCASPASGSSAASIASNQHRLIQKTALTTNSNSSSSCSSADDANSTSSPPSCSATDHDVIGSAATSKDSVDTCNCIVHQVFFGDLESVISYQGCEHRSYTVDPFLDLSLDVAQRGSTSLAACLTSYFRPEAIDGLLFCSQCKVGRSAVKQFSLLHLPNVLCFYLKRCHHDTKITTSISFPPELDLTPFVAQLSNSRSSWQDRYSLYAVLNHSGQTNSGHYTAFIRSAPGCWCLCDDQKICPVSIDRVLNTDAYVLLYHKNLLAFRT